jgi:RecG-like helicase
MQSGAAADLRVADLIVDLDVYRSAKTAAQEIVRRDPTLAQPAHAGLRAALATQPSTRALLVSS